MRADILRMGPSDAHLLANVAEDVFDEAVDPARLAAYLAADNHLMVVAVFDGVVVGQGRAMVHFHPDEPNGLYVDNLGVTPAMHRRGIGRRIMDELIAWGRERGCAHAWVATEADNGPAIALYERLGAPAQPMVYFEYEIDG